MGKVVCVFGSASDVGKSTVAAALCRLLSDRHGVEGGLVGQCGKVHTVPGVVAPYKAQNMSNNAGVARISTAPEGEWGEMGRAQIVQAQAARCVEETDMNPVLLKPCSDTASQVVVNGVALGTQQARELFRRRADGLDGHPLRHAAVAALRRLQDKYKYVVVEGAGSCCEVNLRDRDYVNFDVPRSLGGAPVLLVCDIEKGGVFAQVVGTLECLPEEDRALVKAIVINRFRGDPTLFDDGREWLEQRTGLPVLAVIPWFDPLNIGGTRGFLDAEDALYPTSRVDPPPGDPIGEGKHRVAIILFPRISNHNDFAPLEAHPDVVVDWLRTPRDLSGYHMVILPGSKAVRSDLQWAEGWGPYILKYKVGVLLGVCGGYQMLGESIADPDGIEGAPGTSRGFGVFPVHTVLRRDKVVKHVEGVVWPLDVLLPKGSVLSGYEIHVGETTGGNGTTPVECVTGNAIGTYLHGLFDAAPLCLGESVSQPPPCLDCKRDVAHDALASHLRSALGPVGLQRLLEIIDGC